MTAYSNYIYIMILITYVYNNLALLTNKYVFLYFATLKEVNELKDLTHSCL